MEKMREEFESEMRSMGMFEQGGAAMERCKESGGYADQDTNAMWSGFIAGWVRSRAALCVKLPSAWYLDVEGCILNREDDVKSSLDDAGVRYE